MKSIEIDDIALRAKGVRPGPVLEIEVETARDILQKRSADAIAAIYIVGLCGRPDDAPLLEGYLHDSLNDQYAEYALKALCRYLGLIDRYRPLVREWIKGRDDRRRMPAIHLAKEYFQDFVDQELGCYLIDVLCDLEDDCRGAVRDSLVDIFNLRGHLNDPWGLNDSDWDQDTTLIVNVASAWFGHPGPTIRHQQPSH
jgi:hypothetical protein